MILQCKISWNILGNSRVKFYPVFMNHFKIILRNEWKKGLIKYLRSKYMRFQVQTLQCIARVSGVGTYFHQAVWKISVTKCTRWVVLLSWHESIILATISWTGCRGMLQIRKKKVNKWYTLRCETEQWWLMTGGGNTARLQKEKDSDCTL